MDKYTKIKVVGKGSFGYAVLVKSNVQTPQKYYIIKIIDISKMDRKQREEALNEVHVLKAMRHPYIITYRESFMEKRCLCIVMDFADGGDLYAKIAKQKEKKQLFPEKQILDWFVQMALALKHVHDRKILHRDLKTQNIFLTSKGDVKIGDFGIARVLQHTYDCAKTAIGTPYYLSPEICQEKPYNQKSDIWSLGCILYELTTLQHAFDANSMKNLVLKILKGNYPQIPDQYSPELKQLIADMLIKDPAKRPSIRKILERDFLKKRIGELFQNTLNKHEFQENQEIINNLMQNNSGTNQNANNNNQNSNSNLKKENIPPQPGQQPTSSSLQQKSIDQKQQQQQDIKQQYQYNSGSNQQSSSNSIKQYNVLQQQNQNVVNNYLQQKNPQLLQQQQQQQKSQRSSSPHQNYYQYNNNSSSNSNQQSQPANQPNSLLIFQQQQQQLNEKQKQSQNSSYISNSSSSHQVSRERSYSKENNLKQMNNQVINENLKYIQDKYKNQVPSQQQQQSQQNLQPASSITQIQQSNGQQNQNFRKNNNHSSNSNKNGEESLQEQGYGYLLESMKDCLNNKKPQNSNGNNEDDYFEDKAKIVPKFLEVDGKPFIIPGTSEKDTTGQKIEALRYYLEKQIGLSQFLNAYNIVQNNETSQDEGRLLLQLMGNQNIKYIPLIYQLIVCEESYYENQNKV